jgi:Tol biopolymer transport system component
VAWRPDGSRLSYLGWETLFDLKPDGSDRRALLDVSKYYALQGWSPDNRYLALGIGRVNMHTWAAGVSLLPDEGGELKHLRVLGSTAWSPNGRQLAYTDKGTWYDGLPTEEQSKAAGLYAIDVESQQRARLTHSGTSLDLYPAWFPDGRHLGFLRFARYEDTGDLYLLTLNSGHLVRYATDVEEFAVAPDGSRWAWTTPSALFTKSLDASNASRLMNQGASSLTWSPDGKTLAYVADSPRSRRDIYTVSIEDRRVRRVTKTAAEELEVQWRPD